MQLFLAWYREYADDLLLKCIYEILACTSCKCIDTTHHISITLCGRRICRFSLSTRNVEYVIACLLCELCRNYQNMLSFIRKKHTLLSQNVIGTSHHLKLFSTWMFNNIEIVFDGIVTIRANNSAEWTSRPEKFSSLLNQLDLWFLKYDAVTDILIGIRIVAFS